MRIEGTVKADVLQLGPAGWFGCRESHLIKFEETVDKFPANPKLYGSRPAGEVCILAHQKIKVEGGIIHVILTFTGPDEFKAASSTGVSIPYRITIKNFQGRNLTATLEELLIWPSKEDMKDLAALFIHLGY